LHPPDLQWVNVPRGEHDFVEPAIGQGLKLARDFFRTWHWKNRPEPLPVAGARIEKQASDPAPAIYFYRAPPGYEYAAVVHPDGSRSICSAHGTGGNLDVACDTPQAGLFVLEENRWTGWYAQVDGQAVELQPARWLAVELPAGQHTVTFRYRPWDVLIGLVLSFIGVGLACYYGLRAVQSR
jgi:hypothetical protein